MIGVFWRNASLQRKLINVCVLIQLAAAALLLFGSMRLLERTLIDQAGHETRQVMALLDQAIAAPLAQRDYAAIQQTLDLVRDDASITYLVLCDHRGKIIAASGWDPARPLPALDHDAIDLDRADATRHAMVPIMVAGEQLGQIDFGLSTTRLREARANFLWRGFGIGAAALIASTGVLAAIAFAITRHLARLASATRRVAGGDLDALVPVTTRDEIGLLGASFNAMAVALKSRIAALETSGMRQRLHLHVAREEQARLTTLLGAMPGGIMFVDAQARVIYANASFARIWSIPELAVGQALSEIIPSLVLRTNLASAAHLEAILSVDACDPAERLELQMLDGRVIVQRAQPVAQAGEGSGCIWFHDDVTLERQTLQRAHQALHDPLTGLLNRRGLYEFLQAAIGDAEASRTPLALMFIDLDDFKNANDVGGHGIGDDILVTVSRTLVECLRQPGLVARLGGDEFAVVCPGMTAKDAESIAARLVEAVAALRFESATQTLQVGCSIGIASYPADARTEDELIGCADFAMYEAKHNGKNGWATYHHDPLRTKAESARLDWNARIHRALQFGHFVLHFQPVYQAADLRVAHYEALVRMVDEADPTQVISPGDFVPYAERSGKIRQIDRWVFEACIGQLAAADPAICIAANLSARSLEDSTFPSFLRANLQLYHVDPRRLHIELTETSAISDPLAARALIDDLRGLGCAVHLDDIGSGFSSFATLKLLNVDTVKIDGAFVRNLQSDSSNRLFVASMIAIAHDLDKTVVAEHIEDVATFETLRGLGVDLVQGFHFGRPSAQIPDTRPPARLQVVADGRRRGVVQNPPFLGHIRRAETAVQ